MCVCMYGCVLKRSPNEKQDKAKCTNIIIFLVVVCVFKLAAWATLAELAKNKRQQ